MKARGHGSRPGYPVDYLDLLTGLHVELLYCRPDPVKRFLERTIYCDTVARSVPAQVVVYIMQHARTIWKDEKKMDILLQLFAYKITYPFLALVRHALGRPPVRCHGLVRVIDVSVSRSRRIEGEHAPRCGAPRPLAPAPLTCAPRALLPASRARCCSSLTASRSVSGTRRYLICVKEEIC